MFCPEPQPHARKLRSVPLLELASSLCSAWLLTDDKTIGATMSERSTPSDDVEEGVRLTRRGPTSHTEPSLDNGGNLNGAAEHGEFVHVALDHETSHPQEQPPGSAASVTSSTAILCDGRIVD